MKSKKALALLLSAAMLVGGVLSGCNNNGNDTTSGNDGGNGEATGSKGTIILGDTDFNEKLTPFFAATANDNDLQALVCETLISNDRQGAPISNIAEYVEPEVIGDNEQTVYTFTIKDEVRFADGTEPTSDDLIYALKIFCDPSYDGSATFYSLPIVGLNEWRYDDPDYQAKLDEIAEKVASYEPTEDVLKQAMEQLAEENGMAPEDFTADGPYYNDYTLPTAISIYEKSLLKAYTDETFSTTGGNRVPEMAGVERVDDKTIKITLNGVNPKAIWDLGGLPVIPRNHYGAEEYKKGDLSAVKAQNMNPAGTGPYKFVSFENNVVSFEANENYWRGAPKTQKIKYQVVDDAAKISVVQNGDVDITTPQASLDNIKAVDEAGLHHELIDYLGYGYLAINAERIPDANVRKGILTLVSGYRKSAVQTAYGDTATVIERPMSRVSWAYPEGATEYYPGGKDKALEYFLAAGYEQVDGKLMKDGKQLSVSVTVGSLSTHPVAPALSQAKVDMEALGGQLVLNDVDSGVLMEGIDAGSLDVWAAAWQATIDPDMYQIYHSQSAGNTYKLKNAELDKLIEDGLKTLDQEERKEIYTKALDIIMDEAVELPLYQRSDMFIYNPEHVDIESLPKDMSPFYTHKQEMYNLVALS